MIRIRGVVYKDADAAVDAARQEEVDAEAEAKRRASGISAEELSLQDAFLEGQRAAGMGLAASLNPWQHDCPQHHEWLRGWRAVTSMRVAGAR